ncbi:MAG TPA: phosphate ABC transporter permease subunit PstC [Magnetospirillaceae bacterium]|jgi:phosphate transport system permease protein
MTEGLFRGLTLSAAALLLAALIGIGLLLILQSQLSLAAFGLGFLTTDIWNPVKEHFGALAAIYGTLMTSLIAMVVGVPLALGVTFFLAELCPFALRGPLSVAIELLAAVPSIIFGMWGLFVLAPFLAAYIQPALIAVLGPIPLIGALFQGPPFGIGMLTAGLILGVMILPYITAVARQVIATVPPMLREAAYGVGATRWEVFRRVLIPYASRGLLGGVMLGLGRALGETMAVTFVIGNAHHLAASLLAPGTTISASLANEFTEAESDLYQSSLLELGLILFVLTFVVLAAARFMLASAGRKVKV